LGESARKIAQIHAALSDRDAALSSEGDVPLAHLWVNPAYDNLQTDSRFLELSSRVGLSKH